MGCSTTLGSFARYIELCPPPFGYSSKHMESLRCLLLRRLMINRYVAWVLSLVVLLSKGSLSLSPSRPLCNMSLVYIPDHPECPIKSLLEITEAFSLIIKIINFVHAQRAVEDLWVVQSYTHITLLPEFWRFWSCCSSFEALIFSHQALSASTKMDTLHVYLLISRCSSAVYC